MRGAVRGVTPLRGIRIRAYNFSAYFKVEGGARIVLYQQLSIPRHVTRRKHKL
jgi:hypothetical protein